jgi:hypothetical protein
MPICIHCVLVCPPLAPICIHPALICNLHEFTFVRPKKEAQRNTCTVPEKDAPRLSKDFETVEEA